MIERTDLVPIGLVVASLWGTIRFWYYGLMVQLAPWRRRRELLRSFKRLSNEENYGLLVESEEQAKELIREMRTLFPRFLNRPVLSRIHRKTGVRIAPRGGAGSN